MIEDGTNQCGAECWRRNYRIRLPSGPMPFNFPESGFKATPQIGSSEYHEIMASIMAFSVGLGLMAFVVLAMSGK